MYTTKRDVLTRGTVLVRHYDSDYDLDRQCCGPLSYYQAVEDQMASGALLYYDRASGRNKFFEKVELNIYAPLLQGTPAWPSGFGGADCLNLGNGQSRVRITWFDPASSGSYKLPAAISHEFGHAFHNWTRCFEGTAYAAQFSAFFERLVSSNHTTFSATAKPWDQPLGAGSRDEDRFEQFANAWRYFFGVLCTRGVSGQEPEKVLPGFEDPAAHPEWGKQLRTLPELTAFWDRYGLKEPSLSWQGGADGFWQFQRSDGTYIAQTDFNTWFRWDGTLWAQFWPSYDRT